MPAADSVEAHSQDNGKRGLDVRQRWREFVTAMVISLKRFGRVVSAFIREMTMYVRLPPPL